MNESLYLWIKVFHLVFIVAWFAGLFYIFRLFVYHVQNKSQTQVARVFETMERKLLKVIIYPGSVLTILFGASLLYLEPRWLDQKWIYFKLAGVLLLLAYQFLSAHVQKQFAKGNFFLSERACRFINEVPTLLLLWIVAWVVLKPF